MKAKTVAKVKVKSKVKRVAQPPAGERRGVSSDYVIDLLVSTINRCRQAEPVMVRGVVVPGEYKFDVANVLRATEMLGRHLKMFTDKVEHDGKVKLESLVVGGDDTAEERQKSSRKVRGGR